VSHAAWQQLWADGCWEQTGSTSVTHTGAGGQEDRSGLPRCTAAVEQGSANINHTKYAIALLLLLLLLSLEFKILLSLPLSLPYFTRKVTLR